jgi:HSP20 family protein
MFFTATTPAHFRRFAYGPNGHVSRSLERFLDDTIQTNRQTSATFEQDDTSFTLSFDVPGIAKDQLTIGIEGNVVRITSKEGAPRQYKAAYELPQDIDPTASEAKLDNGVLTLKLGKKVVVSPVSELTIH